MPRIPISDIPNAPRPVAMPTGGNLQGVNLGRAQSLLQQDTISPDAFQGPAKGLQALSAGLSGLSKGAQDIGRAALYIQKERDDNMLFRARADLKAAMSEASLEIEKNPFDYTRYGEITTGHLDRAMNGFLEKNKDLSVEARERLGVEFAATRRVAFAEAQKMGFSRMRGENREGTLNDYEALLKSGNTQEAIALAEEQRGGGRFTDPELDKMVWDANMKTEENRFLILMNQDPNRAAEEAMDEEKFPHWSPVARVQKRDMARTEHRKNKADAMQRISELRENDGTLEQAREIAMEVPGLWGSNEKAITRMFAGPPNKEAEKRDFLDLMGRSSQVEPGDHDSFYDLSQEIDEKLSGDAKQQARNFLSKVVNEDEKPSTQLSKYAVRAIKDYTKIGLFGDSKSDDPVERQMVIFREGKALDGILKEVSKHPEWTVKDVRSFATQYIKDNDLEVVPEVGDWRLFNPFSWGRTKPGKSRLPETPSRNDDAERMKRIQLAADEYAPLPKP